MTDDLDALVKAKQRALDRAKARKEAENRENKALARIRKLEKQLATRQGFLIGMLRDVELTAAEQSSLAGILERVANKPADWGKIKKWTSPVSKPDPVEFSPTRPKVAMGG